LNEQKRVVIDTRYLNVLEIMNSITKLLIFALALFTFILGMTIAYYDAVILRDPPIHYSIESRALNYTDKDCYTKCDIELIVFGKIVNHE
jgi:hypothetical protein